MIRRYSQQRKRKQWAIKVEPGELPSISRGVLVTSVNPVWPGIANSRCIERPSALIPGINRTQHLAMITSPDVYDYYDVWKWGNRLTLGLNGAQNTNYMKKVSSKSYLELNSLQNSHWTHMYISPFPPLRVELGGSKDGHVWIL